MILKASEVPVNRLFDANGRIWVMRVQPRAGVGDGQGLCQNIDDDSYWAIDKDKLVTLRPEKPQLP